ncbi:MAG: exodeoxyribonuclease VII large subunit [Brevundimonas sp.]|uniref:exodeoxyribonuclease VII large subunit n=1 Tax=Brevundimonas sp. TaxID=1871086 RepID=UPI00391980D3
MSGNRDGGANDAPWSVSELSFALKRTLEDRFGFVRLRAEVSKVNRHSSGHVYLTLKDERAAIDGVIWKGVAARLPTRPETGLEVIVTGKITSYPARSSYQIVIDTLEPAGVGALLAQLERLKETMRAEGLFAPERKRPLPAYPRTIGVITSPTGAVIRDILHRLSERWPCRVLVWPVVVQGEAASGQVIRALKGFAALSAEGPVPRPDVVIVARGGGSVEDLWPFNDEALARTVAALDLPVISAIGHETDTTLIDLVADRRAPTPTAAAEMAAPVLSELRAFVDEQGRRLTLASGRMIEERRTRLRAAARGLPSRPEDLLALPGQRLDLATSRLGASLQRNVSVHERALAGAGARLSSAALLRSLAARRERVDELHARLTSGLTRTLPRESERLSRLSRLLLSLNPDSPLQRGFARVHRSDGALVHGAGDLSDGDAVRLVFADGQHEALIGSGTKGEKAAADKPAAARKAPRAAAPSSRQGDLF